MSSCVYRIRARRLGAVETAVDEVFGRHLSSQGREKEIPTRLKILEKAKSNICLFPSISDRSAIWGLDWPLRNTTLGTPSVATAAQRYRLAMQSIHHPPRTSNSNCNCR
ncbi:hypothetical protein K440DRAFT_628070 [Wilcoxina mikolae CBS 423.85]|nr:hypothetical protein K440DRAFT_628070 [Wilcoxina mikolae CBS 423.85]